MDGKGGKGRRKVGKGGGVPGLDLGKGGGGGGGVRVDGGGGGGGGGMDAGKSGSKKK